MAVVAGFVHESLPLDAQRQLLAHLSARTGRPIDVATSCGLGRRDRTHADAAMEATAALCGPGG